MSESPRLRLWQLAPHDLEALARPPLETDPTLPLRCLDRYYLPQSRAAWQREVMPPAAFADWDRSGVGLPQLLFLFIFCRQEWRAIPHWVTLYADLLDLIRAELTAELEREFPPGVAIYCPDCSAGVHSQRDVYFGLRQSGEPGWCNWCCKVVSPVAWEAIRHLLEVTV